MRHGLSGQALPGKDKFRLLQGAFRPADAPFGLGLGCERASVPGQIQLTPEGIFHIRQTLEVFHRAFHTAAGRTLQISAAVGHFYHFSGRTSAAVAKAKGIHESVDIFLLHPVLFPAGDQVAGVKIGIVLFEGMGQHLASIHTLPPEDIIRKRLRLGILADQLLGRKVRDPAFFQYLGQRCRKAKGIRHPGHLTVHSQFLTEPTLALDQLADQRFAGRDIGIRFDPKSTLGNEGTGSNFITHPLVYIGIKLLEIFQNGRLTQ